MQATFVVPVAGTHVSKNGDNTVEQIADASTHESGHDESHINIRYESLIVNLVDSRAVHARDGISEMVFRFP
jgi:hypothetical protein